MILLVIMGGLCPNPKPPVDCHGAVASVFPQGWSEFNPLPIVVA